MPIQTEAVVRRIEVPWGIAFLSNTEFLVTERPGRLRLVRDGALVPKPVFEVETPDGFLYLTTSNCDGRGDCPDSKDAMARVRAGRSH